jgi:dihydropteroate synthase
MIRLVGIINVTPDSFSDGGKYQSTAEVIAAIEQMMADGADVVDIGAESTRPGATPLDADEEWERLAPLMAEIDKLHNPFVKLSVDTRHATTAERVLDAGVHMINDVSGFTNVDMINAVLKSKCQLVVTHSLGVPADPGDIMDESLDVVTEVMQQGGQMLQSLVEAGIKPERLIFDPGIGFGKNTLQSLTLLQRIGELKELGVPLYVGHSRKSCLKAVAENSALSMDEATLTISQLLMQQQVNYIRVHDVAAHHQLRMLMKEAS